MRDGPACRLLAASDDAVFAKATGAQAGRVVLFASNDEMLNDVYTHDLPSFP